VQQVHHGGHLDANYIVVKPMQSRTKKEMNPADSAIIDID
jgi:hypothetical protein